MNQSKTKLWNSGPNDDGCNTHFLFSDYGNLLTERREQQEREQQREIERLEAIRKRQLAEDRQKQNALEMKLKESKDREDAMRASKARADAMRENLVKKLEDMRLQQQKEIDAEERRRKYLEPLKTPWRRISTVWDDPWKREFKTELQLKINTLKPAGGINYYNILLLGQAASGKSSFYNTCFAALMDDNRLTTNQQVYQGASSSVSTSVEAIPMKTKGGNTLPIRLFDCRGLHMKQGVPTEDIRSIIQGHVKSGYKINPVAPITDEDKGYYRKFPEKKDRMHCIVYVASAGNPSEHLTDKKTEEQLRYVRETVALQHLPQLVLLTNIDKVKISNTNNLQDIFRSQGVRDTCDKAAKYMEIPLMNVLPMSNYHEENLPTLEKDILALFYLLTMMQRANDYIIRITRDDVPADFYE